jgi:hypothetical protein
MPGVEALLVNKFQVDLVDEFRRAKSVVMVLPPDVPAGQRSEFIVHQRHECFECRAVPVAKANKQLGYLPNRVSGMSL